MWPQFNLGQLSELLNLMIQSQIYINYYLDMKSLLKILLIATLVLICTARSQYKVTTVDRTASTVTLGLTYTGKDTYYVKQTSPIIKDLIFTFHVHAFYDFYVKITDKNHKRYQVPQSTPFPIDPLVNFSFPITAAGVTFSYTSDPFDFKIIRKINQGVIFSTSDIDFVYSQHYMQIGTQLDTQHIYGLGQRFSKAFEKGPGKWTIFNRDRGQVQDEGTGLQTYGFYPFYMVKQYSTFFHINYLRNSNAMDAVIQRNGNKSYLTYKVIGGVFDFRFLLSEQSPEVALQKFHLFVGRSAIPPFWSMGFHQCRWGYKNFSYLEAVMNGYQSNDIPLDTIWSDIDYMVDYQDFTIDQSRFPLDKMNQMLKKYHYIPIVDAGIKINNGVAYNEGKKRGVFIKTAQGQQYSGSVWPGPTTFVDFLHPNATTYWADMLNILYNKVKFSGIWLDMNEIANFCDGTCQGTPKQSGGFDYSKDLPYVPGSDGIQAHTISLNTTHYNNIKQADVHAFNGMLETYATNLFLKSKNQMPFIISRSSTLGTNKYGFHWTGDNYADWTYLRGSINDNFNSQLWGIQMVGPDICGFGGNTTEQLCARWWQLGSLYPFARNHNDYNGKSQQAYALGDKVMKAARQNLKLRYSLLKYYYSVFVRKRGIGSIFKPLFFEYPTDNNLYIEELCDTQFLIGPDIMAAPIVEQGKTSRNVYFPLADWYDLHTGTLYKNGTSTISNVQITDKVPLFIRIGTAVLLQDTTTVRQTKDLGNVFRVVGAFFLDTRRSNSTVKYYRSSTSMIGIKDYNDQNKIATCISQGCEYVFNMLLTQAQTSRILEFDVSYVGAFGLSELLVIDTVTVMYEGKMVTAKLTNPVEILGPKKIVIPIPDEDLAQE